MSVKRDSVLNLGGTLVPAVLALVTIPLYLSTIGAERFGLLTLAWIVSGTFGFFDLGLTRAATVRIAGDDSTESRRVVTGTAFILALLSSAVAVPVVYTLSFVYIIYGLAAAPAIIAEARNALWLVALLVPLNLFTVIMVGLLQGRQDFLRSNALTVLTGIATQVLPIAAVFAGWSSIGNLLAAIIFGRLIVVLLGALMVARIVTDGWRWRATAAEAKAMLSFGKWVMANSVLGPIILYADRLAIGSIVGPAGVAIYNIPFQFAQRIGLLPNAVGAAVIPRMARDNDERATAQGRAVIRFVGRIVIPFAVVAILSCDPFFRLWLGSHYSPVVTSIAIPMIVAFSANCFTVVMHSYVIARGRPELVTASMAAELVPYIALIWTFAHHWGAIGAAYAFLILCIVDAALVALLIRDRLGTASYLTGLIGASAFAAGVALTMLHRI